MRGVSRRSSRWPAASSRPRRKARLPGGRLVGLLETALLAGSLLAVTQPMAAAAQDGAIHSSVVPGARSTGVPESDISCAGQRRDDYPTINCTVRFEMPIDVIRPSVVEPGSKLEWTASVFRPFDPTEYDTAFLVLIDRRTVRPAQTRDLSEIFAAARGRQQVAVSTFANDLTRVLPFTTDRGAISNAFSRVNAGGAASELLKNVLEGIRQLQTVSSTRKVLLVASFGKSDDTAYKIDDVVKLAQEAGVHIVSLGYVDQPADSPHLQILERMARETGGFYYKSDGKRPLPQDVRNTILTRYSSGGKFEATAPTKELPGSVGITLKHPGNLTSEFTVNLAEAASEGTSDGKKTQESRAAIAPSWLKMSKLGIFAIAAVAVLLIVLASLLIRPRRGAVDAKEAPLPPDDIRENPKPQREAMPFNAAEPGAAARSGNEPAGNLIRNESAGAPPPAGEAPVIAWLEFNSAPGRVAVRKKHVTIGREADNDVITSASEDTVSRHHAVLSVNNNGRFQISNRSTEYRHTPNPIFINDKEMERAELSNGDRVKLGTGSYGFIFVEMH
jgi:FHA domain/von Willebrand factor type A domain